MRPQHLQQHTRYLEGLVSGAFESVGNHGWGFYSLRLDVSELASGRLGVTSATGVFPDATPFRLNESDGRPAMIDLNEVEPGTLVYLCLAPRSGSSQSQEFRNTRNLTGNSTSSVRYLAHAIDVVDNAADLATADDGEEGYPARKPPTAQIVVGQMQTRLMPDNEESRNHIRLPLTRLEDTAMAGGGARLDETFIPSVTRLQASATLMHFVRELQVVVSTRADQTARKVGDLTVGAEFSLDILWLLAMNRYDPLLRNLISIDIHPAELYRMLLGMAGEIATLTEREKRPIDFHAYDHDDLTATFSPVIEKLREALAKPSIDVTKELDLIFTKQQHTWTSTIKDHNLLTQAEFVLAAHADIPENELAQQLPEQMIIAPVEQIDKRVSDLRMRVSNVKPKGVPTLNGWVYFQLEQTGKTWNELIESRGFAFFVDRLEQDFPSLQLKFWAISTGY